MTGLDALLFVSLAARRAGPFMVVASVSSVATAWPSALLATLGCVAAIPAGVFPAGKPG